MNNIVVLFTIIKLYLTHKFVKEKSFDLKNKMPKLIFNVLNFISYFAYTIYKILLDIFNETYQ